LILDNATTSGGQKDKKNESKIRRCNNAKRASYIKDRTRKTNGELARRSCESKRSTRR